MTTRNREVTAVQAEEHRRDILKAAEKLFAEKGFSGTSIRQITQQAGCNVAAVNYYFHGKENLYIEVFRLHIGEMKRQRIDAIERMLSDGRKQRPLEQLIENLAMAFLEPFMNKQTGRRLMALMMMERRDPHLPRHVFVEEMVLPIKNIMKAALMQVCPDLDDVGADLCIHSIVGQLVHIIQAQELFKGMDEATVPVLDLKKAVAHVVKFSVGGVLKCMS